MSKLFKRDIHQAAQAEMVEALEANARARWNELAAAYEPIADENHIPIERVLQWLRIYGEIPVAVFRMVCKFYAEAHARRRESETVERK